MPHARWKESDRIHLTVVNLEGLGADVEELEAGLRVRPGHGGLQAGTWDPEGDHRLFMSGVVAGLAAQGAVEVRDAGCEAVSYPHFLKDLRALGAMMKEK